MYSVFEERPSMEKKMDVVVLTKDSEQSLRRCLTSVYENVPVNRLIVVDGFSTDRTLEIVEEFRKKYGNVKVILERGTRAVARERGIREVGTEWFMFVDSDVVLCRGWFDRACGYMREGVGAVWGVNLDVIPNVRSRFLLKLLGLVDILVRTELVKDIRIPSYLHVFEDAYIVDWIRAKGYRVVVGDDLYCLHFKPREDWSVKESLALVSLELRCLFRNVRKLKYIFYYPFFVLYWLIHGVWNR